MQVFFGLSNFDPEWSQSVVCVGTFDGIHLGHRRVIAKAVSIAGSKGVTSCLLTFDRHPASILAPERCPPAIMGLEARLERIRHLGVSVAVVMAFDRDLSQIEAPTFLKSILLEKLKAQQVVVGHDFAMGKGRKGDAEWLRSQISTEVLPPFEIDGVRVSSSSVRQAIQGGDMKTAALLLGEPFELSGVVVSGDRLGRTLGYPTANVATSFNQVTPADGVYAGRLVQQDEVFPAAISIGTRPAVQGEDRRIEAFCLNYEGGELYGKAVSLTFLERLRSQESFSTLDQLKEQIHRDVDRTRTIVATSPGPASVMA